MGAREKNIATMEAGLKKLETQEQKYSAELDKALSEYAELKEQQLEDALQKKPSFSLLLSAKQETSRLLKEDAEERQVRQMVMQRQAAQQKRSLRSAWKKNDFER